MPAFPWDSPTASGHDAPPGRNLPAAGRIRDRRGNVPFAVRARALAPALFALAFACIPPASAAEDQVWTPEADPSAIANPERGWLWPINPVCCGQDEPHPPISAADLAGLRDGPERVTLVRDLVQLGMFLDSPISDARLAEIEADWDTIRAAGLKVVPRFLYDWSMHNREPPTEIIAGHLDQLAPILTRNADVIAWLEGGLFGGSGEAAASDQGHVIEATEWDRWQQLSDGAIWLYNRMSEALPGRCIALRYPRYRLQMLEKAPDTCWGYFNDGFMGDENSYAFFVLPFERAWVETDARPVPMGGELSISNDYNLQPGIVVPEMTRLRQTSLNLNATDALPTLAAWRASGEMDELTRRMGYRLRVERLALPACIGPDGRLTVEIGLANDGFAAPVNARTLYLKLGETTVPLVTDLRAAAPGETLALRADLTVPVPEGPLPVTLWLPDSSPRLAEDPRQSVRLANDGGWDAATGLNLTPLTLGPC
jgi:hypothetical protein